MSELVVSRSPSGLTKAGQKSEICFPKIQHPLARLEDVSQLDVRGVSQSGGCGPAASISGRPVPSEGLPARRKSVIGGTGFRSSRLSCSSVSAPCHDTIPEGVEVIHGDPNTTRLPVFGSRACASFAGDVVPRRQDLKQRLHSRLSLASVQSKLEMDELEMLLREKVKRNYDDVKNRFIVNDPDHKGNVTRDALYHIIVALVDRALSLSTYNRLLDRIGLKEKIGLNYADFFSCFRENESPGFLRVMEPALRPQNDRAHMTASQVHAQLRDQIKLRSLVFSDLIPQSRPNAAGAIMKHEFRNILENIGFFMDDGEYDKLWIRYDEENQHMLNAESLRRKLSIPNDPKDKSSSIEDKGINGLPDLVSSRANSKRARPMRKREHDRQLSLDVERWLKNKFREGFWSLKAKFEVKDPNKTGLVSRMDFLELLAENGLNLEKSYLNTFLARCCVAVDKRGIPYVDFLQKFQDRGDAGFAHKILTNPKHRFNARPESVTHSTMSAVESQLMNMFQREFLALLGTFQSIDKIGLDTITQEEFRAAIESRFGLEISDEQFRGLIDKVPLTDDGLIKYPQFMAQFDCRGVAKSLYEPAENHVALPQPSQTDDMLETKSGNAQNHADDNMQVIHADEMVYEFPQHRSTQELFILIKSLLKRRPQDVEKSFYDLDDVNSGQMSQETMYQLLKRFDIEPEVSRGEIRDLWKTFIVGQSGTLNYHEFVRHFGYSPRSAAFPNAKLCPPRRGDADCMQRSRKLNSTTILITDNIRAKIEYMFEDLCRDFRDMDPFRTGFVCIPEFKDILTELNIHIADWEMDQVVKKFDLRQDGRISYIEFLRPFAMKRQSWHHSDNILGLLDNVQGQANISDTLASPKEGLHGITEKLRQKLSGDWRILRRAFKKLDSDNTGCLSVPEFRSVLKLANVTFNEDELYHLMSEFDEGLTGNIKYTKFLRNTFHNVKSRNSIV